MERVAGMTRYLKPEFLQELAEPCVPDEAYFAVTIGRKTLPRASFSRFPID
jgi:hypothetical protein